MVSHVEREKCDADSGALAEGVWEYVNHLLKAYCPSDDYQECYQVLT